MPLDEAERTDVKRIVLYAVMAYLFGLLSRLSLLSEVAGHPEYSFKGKVIPLWTADAGYIGAHAKRLLAGEYVPLDNEHAAGHLIALFVKLFGASVDTVMFYAPAFLAPLIVIPVILILSLYKMPLTGMLAAMLGSIGFNFYFRTHLGYADTDMLIFFFVFMLLYSMIAIAERQSFYTVLIGFVSIVLLAGWYHSYKPLVVGILAYYFVYILLADRKNLTHYFALILFGVALSPVVFWAKMIAGGGVLAVRELLLRRFPRMMDYRLWFAFTLISGSVATLFVIRNPKYYQRIVAYLGEQGPAVFSDANGTKYALADSLKGISEAMQMPFSESITYMSGTVWLFMFGVAGLIVLAFYKRSSLLLWSMLGLGVGATVLGVRFTTFAVPVMAIGMMVALRLVYRMLMARFGRVPAFLTAAAILAAIFASAFSTIEKYNKILTPVYFSDEAQLMAKLEQTGRSDDYIVAWWDDGWPLWYGTGKRTLVDNGKHGIDNYLVAKMWFSTNEVLSANMARYFLGRYAKINDRRSILRRVAGTRDFQALMKRLARPPVLPSDGFDIYFYFHDDMIEKLPVIQKFSVLNGQDPFAGELLSYTYLTQPFSLHDRFVRAQWITLDRKTGRVQTADGQEGRVARLIVSDGRQIKIQAFYKDSDYNLIVYKNRYLLMLTDKYLHTFVIKSLLLGQYDPHLFTRVFTAEHGTLLRLK